MASQQSAKNPYQWPDGSWHSISFQQHTRNQHDAQVQRIAQAGAAAGSPSLQANLAAQPGQSVAGTPPPSPQPADPNAELAKLQGNRNLGIARGESAYQTGNLGFDLGYNPDGTVNTANPYSRAALLQLGYENQQRGTTNSLAAAGQLYSGAIENQRGIDSSNYARSEAANRLAYQRGLHGIQAGLLGTMANTGLSASDNDFSSLLKNVYGT